MLLTSIADSFLGLLTIFSGSMTAFTVYSGFWGDSTGSMGMGDSDSTRLIGVGDSDSTGSMSMGDSAGTGRMGRAIVT